MKTETSSIWKNAINSGLISGALSLLVILVGMVESFGDANIISGLISLGDIILIAPLIALTYSTLRNAHNYAKGTLVGMSAVIGLLSGFLVTLFILLAQVVDLRIMFVNASPTLFIMLMRGVPLPLGALVPPLQSMVVAWLVLGILSV